MWVFGGVTGTVRAIYTDGAETSREKVRLLLYNIFVVRRAIGDGDIAVSSDRIYLFFIYYYCFSFFFFFFRKTEMTEKKRLRFRRPFNLYGTRGVRKTRRRRRRRRECVRSKRKQWKP